MLAELVRECCRGRVAFVGELNKPLEELGPKGVELGVAFCRLGLDLLDPDPEGSDQWVLLALAPARCSTRAWRVGCQAASSVEQVDAHSQSFDRKLRRSHCLLRACP